MILRRPLILTLALLLLLEMMMFAFLVFQGNRQMQAAEIQQDHALQTAFYQELRFISDQVQVIASQVAANPEIQATLASGDHQRLLELSQPGFAALAEGFDLIEYAFLVPPARIFLDLSDPNRQSEDAPKDRGIVTQSGKSASGIGTGPSGLSMRNSAPVYFNEHLAGSLYIALGLRAPFIQQMKSIYGHDWQLSLVSYMAGPQMLPPLTSHRASSDLVLLDGTRPKPVFASPQAYQLILAQGIPQSSLTRVDGQPFRILSLPLEDSSGQVIAVVDIIQSRSPALLARNRELAVQAGVLLFVLFLSGIGAVFVQQTYIGSLQKLDRIAAELASATSQARGSVRRAPETAPGEIGRIGFNLNRLAARVRLLERDLESQFALRTEQQDSRIHQVQRASQLARDLVPAHSLEELLREAVELIANRFGFDQVAVFLIDEANEYARLVAASGSQSQALMEGGYKLRIGQVGPVGYVTATGKSRAVAEIDADANHDSDALLPGARSQLALPLQASTRLIGALDLQSTTTRDFDSEETAILRIAADQLAFSIERMLFLEQAAQQLPVERESVSMIHHHRPELLSYEFDGIRMAPKSSAQVQLLPASTRQRLARGETVIHSSTTNGASHPGSTLLVPIRLYEELIGVIGIEDSNPQYVWPADVIAITEAIADQAAQTLENARLYQETQEIAHRERLIAEISGKMQRAANVEDLLTRTLHDLQTSLGAAYAVVRLNTDLIHEDSTPGAHPDDDSRPEKSDG